MRLDLAELVPAIAACVAIPAYMGLHGSSAWHFAAYICVAAFGLTAGECLTAKDGYGDDAELPVKLGFWLAATASLGAFPYFLGRFALEFLS